MQSRRSWSIGCCIRLMSHRQVFEVEKSSSSAWRLVIPTSGWYACPSILSPQVCSCCSCHHLCCLGKLWVTRGCSLTASRRAISCSGDGWLCRPPCDVVLGVAIVVVFVSVIVSAPTAPSPFSPSASLLSVLLAVASRGCSVGGIDDTIGCIGSSQRPWFLVCVLFMYPSLFIWNMFISLTRDAIKYTNAARL